MSNIVIKVNSNTTGNKGFLIAPDGGRTFPVPLNLSTDDNSSASVTIDVTPNGAGVAVPGGNINIPPGGLTIPIFATAVSATVGDTVINVHLGAVKTTFALTAISNPQIWFKGRFEARFATDNDWYNDPIGTWGAGNDYYGGPQYPNNPLGNGGAGNGYTFWLENEQPFCPLHTAVDAQGIPLSVPTTTGKTGVGRVVRFNNQIAPRSHAAPVVTVVDGVRGSLKNGALEYFTAGDPVIGVTVDLGQNTYLAQNWESKPGDPPPAENQFIPAINDAGTFEPMAVFEFHIGTSFSGKPASDIDRPKSNGYTGWTDDPNSPLPTTTAIPISFANFVTTRLQALKNDYANLPAADKPTLMAGGQVVTAGLDGIMVAGTGSAEGRNLIRRIQHLAGSSMPTANRPPSPQLAWEGQEEYGVFKYNNNDPASLMAFDGKGGQVNDSITFQPNSSSVIGFLAGYNAFTYYSKLFGFHSDELCGYVYGSLTANPAAHVNQDCLLVLDRSTFGKDEVNAVLTNPSSGGSDTFQDAFYVVVDGFTPDELGLNAGNLKNPPNLPTFLGSFSTLVDPSIAFDTSTGVQLEQQGQFFTLQRITFPFNIKFSTLNAFNNLSLANSSQTYGLSATIANTVTPAGYPSLSATSSTAEFELVFQADPFMSAGETWWVSNDIRVFQVTPALLPANNQVPLAYSSTQYGPDPNTYIGNLIKELNKSFTDPTIQNTPFSGISPNEDQSWVSLAEKDTNGNPVFNFALARVHLRGDTATNVRLFFRLFISSSPDTNFNVMGTFRSQIQTDSSGNPIAGTLIPLLGFPTNDMSSTIPFFAEQRVNTSTQTMTQQSDTPNVQTIPSPTAPTPAAGSEVYAYFGCWLDINQPTLRFPLNPSTQPKPDGPYSTSAMLSIPALIMSNHACLVAEIAYDPDPIPPGANASTSDKLGQRNLSWSSSGNPHPLETHRIPTLFDIRPTSTTVSQNALPDELMIEWGNTPAGSVASIYWPQLDADQVLALASRFYPSKVLRKKDPHTIECVTGSVTYIPIPAGTTPNVAGLLTVDLPQTVRAGQEFNIVVRRVSSRVQPQIDGNLRDRVNSKRQINWRYVVGAFQIRIPVDKQPALLKTEESLLAVFKWKLESIPQTNRWYPVLERYIQQVSGRVDGFGGRASGVKPSQEGFSVPQVIPGGGHLHPKCDEFTGKVEGVIYDRFGDFEGFVLISETGHCHRFHCREKEIERLVRYAWAERTVISVFANRQDPDSPTSIILRRLRKD